MQITSVYRNYNSYIGNNPTNVNASKEIPLTEKNNCYKTPFLGKNYFHSRMFNSKLAFGSLMRNSFIEGKGVNSICPIDTSFFRGLDTLNAARNHIVKNFPNGATILNYACSNGEEPLSLAMLLSDNNHDKRYKIMALDMNPEAIKLAKQGVHSVFTGFYDSFLIEEDSKLTAEQKKLKQRFFDYFEEVSAPDESLNTSENHLINKAGQGEKYQERYFKPKEGAFDGIIEYGGDDKIGNIENVDRLDIEQNKKVGAIIFRNALYYLTGNSFDESILIPSELQDKKINSYNIAPLEKAVAKIYDKLDDNGLLVLGNHSKEYLFKAPPEIPDNETIRFSETERGKLMLINFQKALDSLLPESLAIIKNTIQSMISNISNVRILKKSPLQEILEKDNRFVPVHWDTVDGSPDIKVPTVWKKIAKNG